jgi:hypothetical protein
LTFFNLRKEKRRRKKVCKINWSVFSKKNGFDYPILERPALFLKTQLPRGESPTFSAGLTIRPLRGVGVLEVSPFVVTRDVDISTLTESSRIRQETNCSTAQYQECDDIPKFAQYYDKFEF